MSESKDLVEDQQEWEDTDNVTPETDAIFLKNTALRELIGQHVIVGWDRENKWNAGVLSCEASFADGKTVGYKKCESDDGRPMLWKLEMLERPGNRVRGYERIKETFFVTTDIMWWAPATPKTRED